MSNIFGFRITPGEHNCLECLDKFLKKHCESWMVTEEYGDKLGKLHYQAWASTRLNRRYFQQNFKNAIKASCDSFGVSLDECRDHDAMQRYVLKGSKRGELPKIVNTYGIKQFTRDYVEQYHNAYWDQNASIKADIKDKKTTMFAEMQKYVAYLDRPPTKVQLAEKYLELCIQLDKPIDEYRAKSFLRLIWAKYNPEGRQEVLFKLSDF